MAASGPDRSLKWYATREPLVLVVLSLLAVVSFLGVAGLAGIYHRQQAALGERWYRRGLADLEAGQAESAVTAFHTALRYSRDDFAYQLSLAQALAALHRQGEAQAYLLSLWEREPEDGTVSLELGRIFAAQGAIEPALRYYHNAIYAAWPDHPDQRRRAARLELVDFLLREDAKTQAQSELIALAANLPEDSPLHLKAGGLFVEVEDYEHALQQYRQALKTDGRNPAALAGAGRAAFELGRYPEAEQYLEGAVAASPADSESAQLRQSAALVLQMDPFRRQVSASKRTRMVTEAFAMAGARLKSCSAGTKPLRFFADRAAKKWPFGQQKPALRSNAKCRCPGGWNVGSLPTYGGWTERPLSRSSHRQLRLRRSDRSECLFPNGTFSRGISCLVASLDWLR
jgi:tetratricopeptide (TPR) repeat protein